MNDKDAALLRIVGVEEHVTFSELTDRLPEEAVVARGYVSRSSPYGKWSMNDKMADTEGRLKELDEVGFTLQVLSLPSAGADLLPPKEGLRWAQDVNNKIASRVAAHPTRYAGFAHLPMTNPDASADEVERSVTELGFKGALVSGATEGRYLDHRSFVPLLARAEQLDVPIYLHPAASPKPVRDALYAGLPDDLGFWMSVSDGAGIPTPQSTSYAFYSPARLSVIPISRSSSATWARGFKS